MIIYEVRVTKGGKPVFSHDVPVVKGRSFANDFHAAMETFRKNFPNVGLLEDDVELAVSRKPD